MRLEAKTALITNAGEPQARAQAALFAAEGAAVELIDRDLADEGAWAAAVTEILQRRGRIDILVNNVVADAAGTIPELAPDEWDRVHDRAVTGAFLGIKSVLPAMLQQGAGSIVNVTTVAAVAPPQGISEAHAAAAGAIRILSKDVATDYALEGVRCNTVLAGLVEGGLLGTGPAFGPDLAEEVRLVTPMQRSGSHEDVARAVLFLASDEAGYITGTELVVDGGYVAF